MKENWLAKNPYDLRFGDLHFYDYKMNGWEANSFPIPRFMSEYGVQVKSLFSHLCFIMKFIIKITNVFMK